jgi:hypothetical protein
MVISRLCVVALLATVLAVAACASAGPSPSAVASSSAAASTTPASQPPLSAETANGGGSAAAASPYATTAFSIPLSVVAPASLGSPADMPGILSWTSPANDNDRVRFLAPVELYPPGADTPQPVPVDLVSYVEGLADHGASIADVTTTTIGGTPATLLTATTQDSLDGSLGCPEAGADKAEGCFGLQPELLLRIAILDVAGKPLVAWARTDAAAPNQELLATFEDMLGTVAFR